MKKAAVLVVVALAASGLFAQSPEEMEKFMALSKPGPQHEMLQKTLGKWNSTTTMWVAPNVPPTTSTGTMTAETMLDGRFVKQSWEGEMMGMDFTGIAINGYDNLTKKYTGVWMDTMGTMTMIFEGHCSDADCSELVMSSTFNDPMSGQEMTMRMSTSWPSDDEFRSVSHMILPDGSEMKAMEIVAKRAE